jgi:hypothetical protein
VGAYGLSKSKIMNGLQCPRLLWLQVHRPEVIEYDEATQHVFSVGHQVGRLARELNGPGVLVGSDQDGFRAGDARRVLAETAALLSSPGDTTLFEATFSHDGVLVRNDLLFRKDGRYRLTEVKGSTKAKPHYSTDAAIQTWVLRRSGIPVEEVHLAHLDTGFTYGGDGDYRGLFHEVDVTDEVEALLPAIPGHVDALRAMLKGEEPHAHVGPHCRTPNECPLIERCCGETAEFHVTCLPRGGRLIPLLQQEGYFDLRDVPAGRLSNADHLRVWRATCAGAAGVDATIGAIMRDLPYPRHYLDFETVSFAVPIWAGAHPYEVLPFQFSCHVERADGRLEHVEFLDLSGEQPQRACAEAVIEALGGGDGPVLEYTRYEERVLTGMAQACPDLAPALMAIVARLVDLHPVVHDHYYHPEMRGSWSIKAVVPTIAPELSYDDLDEVQEGTAAQLAYEEAIRPETTPERRDDLRRKLLAYCERDTEVMVALVRHFAEA